MIIIIEKFKELMENIDSKKADRCGTPSKTSNLYTELINENSLAGCTVTFGGHVIPDGNFMVIDQNAQTGIVMYSNNIDVYFNGATTNVYSTANGWADELSYTFPVDFNYDLVQYVEDQKLTLEDITTFIEGSEVTICELNEELKTKASNCIIPETSISLYNAIYNNEPLAGIPLTFNADYLPVSGDDLVITDTSNNISLIAHYDYDPANVYIKITGTTPDIIIYENMVWVTTTTTLPPDFNYNTVSGLENQSNLANNITLDKPSSMITVCNLTEKVYGETGANYDFKDLWVSGSGSDQNDGYTKGTPVETISKALSILEEKSNGERLITVHIQPGFYAVSDITASISNVKFIKYPNTSSDIMIVTDNKPLKFTNSNKLSMNDITFASMSESVEQGAIALGFSDCKDIELYQCGFTATGTSYNNAGILGLTSTNCNILDCAFNYTEGPITNTGAVRLDSSSYCTWNSWSASQTGLDHLIINEGVSFFPEKIYDTSTEVPSDPQNTIGYYNNSIQSSDKTVTNIVFGERPSEAISEASPTTMFFYED